MSNNPKGLFPLMKLPTGVVSSKPSQFGLPGTASSSERIPSSKKAGADYFGEGALTLSDELTGPIGKRTGIEEEFENQL